MIKTYRTSRCPAAFGLLLILILTANAALGQSQTPTASPTKDEPLKTLQWRSIGPFRGGRVTAVAGVLSQPQVYYFGATGGGVWKTTDGGINWEPISDGPVFGTGSVGPLVYRIQIRTRSTSEWGNHR